MAHFLLFWALFYLLHYYNSFNQTYRQEAAWKSKCLDIKPCSLTAARDYCHRQTILLNYLDNYQERIPNKYWTLLNCLSSSVCEYIEECTDFNIDIRKLDTLFIKMPNEMFTRQVLATRQQRPEVSLDKFFRELEKLKRNSNFKDYIGLRNAVTKLCEMPSFQA